VTTRVADILIRARDTLSDSAGDRWSDARLLRDLNEGQKELVLQTNLLRTKVSLFTSTDVADYSFPSDCYKVIRILVEGKKVPLLSHEEMDAFVCKKLNTVLAVNNQGIETWEADTGSTVEAVIFDKLNYDKFKLYPIPKNVKFSNWVLKTITQIPAAIQPSHNPINGILSQATNYTIESIYGIISDFSSDYTNTFINVDPDINGVYGICTAFEDETNSIVLYYYKKPLVIEAITDELEVDSVWDTALKHYIVGMALRDDKDTQNRQMGLEELSFFASSIIQAKKDAAQDFTATKTQFNTFYNNGFTI